MVIKPTVNLKTLLMSQSRRTFIYDGPARIVCDVAHALDEYFGVILTHKKMDRLKLGLESCIDKDIQLKSYEMLFAYNKPQLESLILCEQFEFDVGDTYKLRRDKVIYVMNKHGIKPGQIIDIVTNKNEYKKTKRDYKVINPKVECESLNILAMSNIDIQKTLSTNVRNENIKIIVYVPIEEEVLKNAFTI